MVPITAPGIWKLFGLLLFICVIAVIINAVFRATRDGLARQHDSPTEVLPDSVSFRQQAALTTTRSSGTTARSVASTTSWITNRSTPTLYPGMSGRCRPSPKFRTPIYEPSSMASSTLTRTCSGHCTVFCIMGQLETFFDEHVYPTIASHLVEGFGNQHRNDVIFVTSDHKWRWPFGGAGLPRGPDQWADKGLPFPLPTRKEQCRAWHRFPVVRFLCDNKAADWLTGQQEKGNLCYMSVLDLEKKHQNRYDWVVRARPDYYWMAMPFSTSMKDQCAIFDDQFRIWTRAITPNSLFGAIDKHACVGFIPPYPFRVWRANEAAGSKMANFQRTHVWFLDFWGDMHNTIQNPAPQEQILAKTKTWYNCASLVMSFACDRYWQFDLEPETQYPWAGLMHDGSKIQAAGMKAGDKIPDGDFFRIVLGGLAGAQNKSDLKLLMKSASIFLDTFDVDKHDTRSLRMHSLDLACDKPCVSGAYSRESDQRGWRPQCLTEELRSSKFNKLTGHEGADASLYGLC